jgi:hypothetical protein
MKAKIVQFQIWQNTLYALDAEGTMWKNTVPETSVRWVPIPGPTHSQRYKEDDAIKERERIDISENAHLKSGRPSRTP